MSRINSTLALAGLALLLAACAPVPPAPSGPPAPAPAPAPERTETPDRQPPVIEPEESRQPAPAVQSLLDRGWSRFRQEDYRGALGFAERAQRIDARTPEVYLLMARAQFALYRLDLAEQLVRRGLAFSLRGSTVQRQLQGLLNEIAAASN